MKKALICRYGAYGDCIHASFLPRLLKEQGYDEVIVETNHKGYQIFANNPHVDKLLYLNPEITFKDRMWLLEKHWTLLSEPCDKFINLFGSIETSLLAMENENIYYMNDVVRRRRWSKINYYDFTCAFAGFPELVGKYTNGEVYYTPEEDEIVKSWMRKHQGKFNVLINLSGTGPHKRFVQAKETAKEILDAYDDAHVFTTGSGECLGADFGLDRDFIRDYPERITSISGRFPFRQALRLAKEMDCVIGCESGLMVGATMWKVPTIQLTTASSIESHCKYNENDFSLQSEARCSPCHKGPYQYRGCPSKDGNPMCVYFDVSKILKQVEKSYDRRLACK